jgi:UDPglucose 6-dehydrogenase
MPEDLDKTSNLRIGIAGYGFVGRVVADYYKPDNPIIFDKYSPEQNDVNEADIVFICVPTPFNDGFDDSEVIDVLKRLHRSQIVVIKSTVIPGSCDKYQKKFPKLKILFNPEFLVEKTAERDFFEPERQIIGYTKKSKDVAQVIMDMLPNAPWNLICEAKEAEMAKYVGNAFLATKMIFFEEIFDICLKEKINYGKVKWIVSKDPRIGESHTLIGMDGKRGFAGKCLPKDLASLIEFAERKSEPDLLKIVDWKNGTYNM